MGKFVGKIAAVNRAFKLLLSQSHIGHFCDSFASSV